MMEENIQHIFQNWDKYGLPIFYSKVTSKKTIKDFYEKYIPIDYYNTSEYPVQLPIKPLTKIVNLYE